jgi:preprotein translocase subunit SecD
MKQVLIIALSALVLAGLPTAEAADGPMLQMRRALPTATTDSERMSVFGSASGEVVYVEKKVLFDETALKSATVQKNPDYVCIAITFSAEGRERFAEFTRENIDTRLAIVIDGKLYCAPVIRAEIPGGKAEISGQFGDQEAWELAAKINAAIKKR